MDPLWCFSNSDMAALSLRGVVAEIWCSTPSDYHGGIRETTFMHDCHVTASEHRVVSSIKTTHEQAEEPEMIETAHFILYVADQERAAAFYRAALALKPRLHVSGMTEFELPGGAVLGLMPERGIKKLLGPVIADPAWASGAPRAELYLLVRDAAKAHRRAIAAGAVELSPLSPRDWGHSAAYSLDPDGHVLAFACRSEPA